MKIWDPATGGYLPFQQFLADGAELREDERRVMYGMRSQSQGEDEQGKPLIEANTWGDLKGFFLWPVKAGSRSGLHLWGLAIPALITTPPNDKKSGTRTRRQQDAADKARALPILNDEMAPDTRFQELTVTLPRSSGRLSKGTAGIVVLGTRDDQRGEGAQDRIFFPTGGSLTAVQNAGDPDRSGEGITRGGGGRVAVFPGH